MQYKTASCRKILPVLRFHSKYRCCNSGHNTTLRLAVITNLNAVTEFYVFALATESRRKASYSVFTQAFDSHSMPPCFQAQVRTL
jgi:hypothetical protein